MMLLGEKAGLKVILQPASRGRFNVLPEEVWSFEQLLFWWIPASCQQSGDAPVPEQSSYWWFLS